MHAAGAQTVLRKTADQPTNRSLRSPTFKPIYTVADGFDCSGTFVARPNGSFGCS